MNCEPGDGWECLKAKNLLRCRLCGDPIKAGQWITSDGVHLDCAEQYPDAMFGGPQYVGPDADADHNR